MLKSRSFTPPKGSSYLKHEETEIELFLQSLLGKLFGYYDLYNKREIKYNCGVSVK